MNNDVYHLNLSVRKISGELVKELSEVNRGNTAIDHLTNYDIYAIIEDILDDSFLLIISSRRVFFLGASSSNG